MVAWLAAIGIMAGSGSEVSAQPPIVCTIVSVGKTLPTTCRVTELPAPPVAVGSQAIELADGRRLGIVPGSVQGYIDSSRVIGTGRSHAAEITGWAASPALRRAATAVIVFAAGRFIGSVKPVNLRPDVARDLREPAIARSGFNFDVPLSLLASVDRRITLQVFAVVGGIASPLSLSCAAPPKQFGC